VMLEIGLQASAGYSRGSCTRDNAAFTKPSRCALILQAQYDVQLSLHHTPYFIVVLKFCDTA